VSERFDIRETPLAGVSVIQRNPRTDERGWLERMYCAEELAEVLGSRAIAQVNRTLTRTTGTVRGLHYQVPPSAETKIVSCLRGSIFDVAVDVRHRSATFLQWHAELLSAHNRTTLVIPEGFAHGFQAMESDSEVLYLTTTAYDPPSERGIHPLDLAVGVSWPLAVVNLSARDASHPHLGPEFEGIEV
jgi:dTDP-4-dehydrorhamnose 3,5-epimerase